MPYIKKLHVQTFVSDKFMIGSGQDIYTHAHACGPAITRLQNCVCVIFSILLRLAWPLSELPDGGLSLQ